MNSETIIKSTCPGCGCAALPEPWVLASQAVISNYRFPSAEAAADVPRRDMHLIECPDCRLIFNASLDESCIPYDQQYDNRQGFSPVFVRHLEETAAHLVGCHPIGGGVILEVGCGKGDFLKLVCRAAQGTGIGFDTSCEFEGPGEAGTCFYKRYATEEDVPSKVNALLCRHVVEHVGAIGDFFALLHRMAVAGQADVTYIETPAWEWIVEHEAFWDVFYEHCNYFPMASLARLATSAGFSVLEHRLVFGGQYQALCLGVARDTNPLSDPQPDGAPSLQAFASRFQSSMTALRARVQERREEGGWAIWGAGAKGVSLANHLQDLAPSFVVDVNPGKCGMFIPGTRIPVVAPAPEHLKDAGLILIANSNYLPEIQDTLKRMGFSPCLMAV